MLFLLLPTCSSQLQKYLTVCTTSQENSQEKFQKRQYSLKCITALCSPTGYNCQQTMKKSRLLCLLHLRINTHQWKWKQKKTNQPTSALFPQQQGQIYATGRSWGVRKNGYTLTIRKQESMKSGGLLLIPGVISEKMAQKTKVTSRHPFIQGKSALPLC